MFRDMVKIRRTCRGSTTGQVIDLVGGIKESIREDMNYFLNASTNSPDNSESPL